MKTGFFLALAVILGAAAFFIFTRDNQLPEPMETLSVTSTAFADGGMIPARHTCDGDGVNPPLSFGDVPSGTQSLALIMDDPDAPRGTWVHWVKFDITPTTRVVAEGIEPDGVAGKGTSGNIAYEGPCPPDREHRYFFKVYALDTTLMLPEGASKEDVAEAMRGHILAEGQLMGRYNRN